jgi:hypothetical protein
MDLKEFVGKMVYIFANDVSYQGVLESDDNETVKLIGELNGHEALIIIPKYVIDSVIIPMGDHHE